MTLSVSDGGIESVRKDNIRINQDETLQPGISFDGRDDYSMSDVSHSGISLVNAAIGSPTCDHSTVLVTGLRSNWYAYKRFLHDIETRCDHLLETSISYETWKDVDDIVKDCDKIMKNLAHSTPNEKGPLYLGGRPGKRRSITIGHRENAAKEFHQLQRKMTQENINTTTHGPDHACSASIQRPEPSLPPPVSSTSNSCQDDSCANTPMPSNLLIDELKNQPNKYQSVVAPVPSHGVAPTRPHINVDSLPISTPSKMTVKSPPQSPHNKITCEAAIKILYEDISNMKLAIRQIWIVAKSQLSMCLGDPNGPFAKSILKWNVSLDSSDGPHDSNLNNVLEEACNARTNEHQMTGSLFCEIEQDCVSPLTGMYPDESLPLRSFMRSDHIPQEIIETITRILSLASKSRLRLMWNTSLERGLQAELDEISNVHERSQWHKKILTTNSQHSMYPLRKGDLSGKQPNFHFSKHEDLDGPLLCPVAPPFDPEFQKAVPMIATKVSEPRFGARMRRPKAISSIKYSQINPDDITHDIWNGTESVDAVSADIYIQKYGPIPPGFDITEHEGKPDGEIAAIFRAVKGVYFVKYNSMWFAEWHDIDRVRHRTRFSVQKYGHCTARAMAISKRAEADREKQRQYTKRLAEEKEEARKAAPSVSTYDPSTLYALSPGMYPVSAKMGPTWTGRPDPEDLEIRNKGKRRNMGHLYRKTKKTKSKSSGIASSEVSQSPMMYYTDDGSPQIDPSQDPQEVHECNQMDFSEPKQK